MQNQLETEINYLQDPQCPIGLQIYLGKNNIDAEGVKAIAEVLKSGNWPVGLTLNLKGKNIGDEGAKAIAEALKSGRCPVGLKLNLGNNGIGNEGAKAIAEALKIGKWPVDLKINFRGNSIKNKGAVAISGALEFHGRFLFSGRGDYWLPSEFPRTTPPIGLDINLSYNDFKAESALEFIGCFGAHRYADGLHIKMDSDEYGVGLEHVMEIYRGNYRVKAISSIEVLDGSTSNLSKLPPEIVDLILEKAGFHRRTIGQAYTFLRTYKEKGLNRLNEFLIKHQIGQQDAVSSNPEQFKMNFLDDFFETCQYGPHHKMAQGLLKGLFVLGGIYKKTPNLKNLMNLEKFMDSFDFLARWKPVASHSNEDSLAGSVNCAKKRINSSAADGLPPAKRRRGIEDDGQDSADDEMTDILQTQENLSSVEQNTSYDKRNVVEMPANLSLPSTTQTNSMSFFLQAPVLSNNAQAQTRTRGNVSQTSSEPVTPHLLNPFGNQNL